MLVDGAGCVVLLWIIFIIPRNMSVASNVRRCLFGPLDSSSRRKSSDLSSRYADRDAQRFKERWNYDVRTDTPLSGPYAWITPPSSDIPSVYFKNYNWRCSKRRAQQQGDVDTDDNDDGCSRAALVSQASPVQRGDVNVVLGVSNASQKQVEDETTPPHRSSKSEYSKKPGRNIQSRLEGKQDVYLPSFVTFMFPATSLGQTSHEHDHACLPLMRAYY